MSNTLYSRGVLGESVEASDRPNGRNSLGLLAAAALRMYECYSTGRYQWKEVTV